MTIWSSFPKKWSSWTTGPLISTPDNVPIATTQAVVLLWGHFPTINVYISANIYHLFQSEFRVTLGIKWSLAMFAMFSCTRNYLHKQSPVAFFESHAFPPLPLFLFFIKSWNSLIFPWFSQKFQIPWFFPAGNFFGPFSLFSLFSLSCGNPVYRT